ncbi:hypothetical protein HOD02_01155 [bacterium]|jgi:ABC-type transport system involved in cytochrome c biogenesis permease component|nr:hypothetical protein [bacterium]
MRDFFSLVLLILKKDFVIETREKLNLSYLIILCPTITLIISIFVQSQAIFMEYFLSILIITLLVNQRISRQEISTGGELILIGAPFDLSILCFSKIIFFVILSFIIHLIVFLVFSLILSMNLNSDLIIFISISCLFSIGLSAILTTFSLMLERVKGEGQFMLILVYPLIIPFLVLAHSSILSIQTMTSMEVFESFSFQALLAFDILLLTVCPILFSYSIRR